MSTMEAVEKAGGTSGGTSVGKALAMLSAFGSVGQSVGLTELASRASLPKSSAHRLLAVLGERGYVSRQGRRYRLTKAVPDFGRRSSLDSVNDLRSIAMPFMTSLYVAHPATMHLAVLDGTDVLYVEKLFGHDTVRVPSRAGGRLPALATALGKAILAHSPESRAAEALQTPLPRLTFRTVAAPALLKELLHRARESGVAVDNQGVTLGAACVAVPIFRGPSSEVAGALSLTFDSDQWPSQLAVHALRRAATDIGARLQYPLIAADEDIALSSP
jgi:DNA-binding IclR family transcriptional regulator